MSQGGGAVGVDGVALGSCPDLSKQADGSESSFASQLIVAGGGYVGLATAVGFARSGHHVCIVDIDEHRARMLAGGKLPFDEDSLAVPLREALGSGRIRIYSNYSGVGNRADFAFICTPTPAREDGELDSSSVFSAAKSLLGVLGKPARLVVRSTLSPGTAEKIEAWAHSERDDVEVLVNPEFLREGKALIDFESPSRIVVGGGSEETAGRLLDLYSFSNASRLRTDLRTAELIKLAVNAALAVRVSLANEIAHVAEGIQADIEAVLDGVGGDPRIGKNYLRPGIGFGGSCLPKDMAAFRAAANKNSVETPVFDGASRTNEIALERLVRKALEIKSASDCTRVCVIGIAFKPGSDSVRDSQALRLVRTLLGEEFAVTVFDRRAEPMARKELGEAVEFGQNLDDAVKDSQIALVIDPSLVDHKRLLGSKKLKVLDALGRDFVNS